MISVVNNAIQARNKACAGLCALNGRPSAWDYYEYL